MTNDGLPQTTKEILKFISEAKEFTFIPRPGSDKDPFAFMEELGIRTWYAEEIIKSLKEDECRSKYEGEPCDDLRVRCNRMWHFVHFYAPYEGQSREIYAKVGAVKAKKPDGTKETKIVIVLSFHG